MNHHFSKLTLVTNKGDTLLDEYLVFIKECAQAGITCVQLREKKQSRAGLFTLGKEIKRILAPFNIPLIVNDDPQLALALNADGVHLGQTDGDVLSVRKLLGERKVIGLSINTEEEMKLANALPVDYVGVGTIFPTRNKVNAQRVWGCDALAQIRQNTSKTIIAIGGINESNINTVLHSGADGIAAIGVFHESSNPTLTIKQLLKIMNQ